MRFQTSVKADECMEATEPNWKVRQVVMCRNARRWKECPCHTQLFSVNLQPEHFPPGKGGKGEVVHSARLAQVETYSSWQVN